MTAQGTGAPKAELRARLVNLLTGEYRQLPMEVVYQVFADLMSDAKRRGQGAEPGPIPKHAALVTKLGATDGALLERFIPSVFHEVRGPFGHLSGPDVNAVLGEVAGQVDVMRRASGSREAVVDGSASGSYRTTPPSGNHRSVSTSGANRAHTVRTSSAPRARPPSGNYATTAAGSRPGRRTPSPPRRVATSTPTTGSPATSISAQPRLHRVAPKGLGGRVTVSGNYVAVGGGRETNDGELRIRWLDARKELEIIPLDGIALRGTLNRIVRRGGIAVSLAPAPPAGTEVKVRILLPRPYGLMQVDGRVGLAQGNRVAVAVDQLAGQQLKKVATLLKQSDAELAALRYRDPTQSDEPASPTPTGPAFRPQYAHVTQEQPAVAAVTDLVEDVKKSSAAIEDEISGDMPAGGVAEVIMRYASLHSAVVIEFENRSTRWSAYIRGEAIVDIHTTPTDPRFDIGNLLLRAKAISAGDLDSARQSALAAGRRLEREVTSSGAVEFHRLQAVLSARLKLMVRMLFDASFDRYRMVAYDRLDVEVEAPPVRYAELIFGRVRKSTDELTSPELERQLESSMAKYPEFSPQARKTLARLRLGDREMKLIDEVLDGDVTLRSALSRSPLRRRGTLAFVLALERSGLIGFVDRESSQVRAEHMREPIEQKLKAAKKANGFDLLETHWSAHSAVIDEAFRAAISKLDLDFVIANSTGALRASAQKLHSLLEQAHLRLASREGREDERAGFLTRFERENAVRLCLQRGKLAIFKGDARVARDEYSRVLELDPKNKEATEQLALIGKRR